MNNMQKLKYQKVKISENDSIDLLFNNHRNQNEYILNKNNLWIRNFGKQNCIPKDINNLFGEEEIQILLSNEVNNSNPNHIDLFSEFITVPKILIISDGFGFDSQKEWIKNIPDDVKIICVHGTLRFWDSERLPDYYVLTNPFENALQFFPEKYFPFLIASSRANPSFISNFQNLKFIYNSTPDQNYESPISHNSSKYVDEYRNAIAASLCIAYFMKAEKICLAYPIDAYKEFRETTIKYDDAYVYPQQIMSANIIDSMIFWYRYNRLNTKIVYTGVKNCMLFSKYVYEEDVINFFNE